MKKALSLFLTLGMLLGLMAGCGNESTASSTATSAKTESKTETTAANAQETSTDEAAAEAQASGEASEDYTFTGTWAEYPICDPGTETLTMWCEFPGFLSMIGIDSYKDFSTFAAAEEATGVHIEFTEVSMTTSAELFSLMCASGDYKDLLSGAVQLYGSSSAAIEDEIIIDLKEYAEEYMGNYMTILNDPKNKAAKLSAFNSEDQLAQISSIADDYCPTIGAQIRQDWLDALKLDTPVTYEDWETTLKAFKSEYNCSSALLLSGVTQGSDGMLVGGYGTIGAAESSTGAEVVNMYVKDGQIYNGYVDDSYKAYLKMMAQWYSEGLISPDFITASSDNSQNNTDSEILSGNAGIWYAQGNFIGTYEAQGTDGLAITGIAEPYDPDYTDGVNHFGADSGTDASGSAISVSTGCENPELACQWLDYFFSEDGILLANYGIEGEAFEYDENGNPQFNDFIVNSGNFQFYMVGYTLSGVPTYQDFDKQWFTYGDNVIEAFETWGNCTDSTMSIPTALTLNTEQADEYSSTFSDIKTLAEEYVSKFIVGEYDVDAQWDDYVEKLNSMGLQDCIDIYQEAYDSFMG